MDRKKSKARKRLSPVRRLRAVSLARSSGGGASCERPLVPPCPLPFIHRGLVTSPGTPGTARQARRVPVWAGIRVDRRRRRADVAGGADGGRSGRIGGADDLR